MTGGGRPRGEHATVADRRWTILLAMSLAMAVTEFDETVMAVALPSIDAAFNASLAAVQWVVIAYVLAFAAVLIPARHVGGCERRAARLSGAPPAPRSRRL